MRGLQELAFKEEERTCMGNWDEGRKLGRNVRCELYFIVAITK